MARFDGLDTHEAFAALIKAIVETGRAPEPAEYRTAHHELMIALQADCSSAQAARLTKERRATDALIAFYHAHSARLEISHVSE